MSKRKDRAGSRSVGAHCLWRLRVGVSGDTVSLPISRVNPKSAKRIINFELNFTKFLRSSSALDAATRGLHINFERDFPMLRCYIQTAEALKRLRADARGVVSFEYVLVAGAVVGAVALAFGTAGGAGPISTALANAITNVTSQLP